MPRTPKKVPTSRLTLDLAQPVRDQLDTLRAKTSADSLVEVVRRAIAVYEFLWQEREKGREVITRGGGIEREIVLL